MNNSLIAALFLALSLVLHPYDAVDPAKTEEFGNPVVVCDGVEFDTPLSGDLFRVLESGNYYLTGDCRLRSRVMISGEVNLCLNGYKIDAHNATTLQVNRGGVLSVYDGSGSGLIGFVGGRDHNHPVTVDAGGTFNLYGGWLYAKNGSNAVNSKGTVNIYGGVVESCDPGHCAIRNEYVLNLYGGTIRGDLGISQRSGAKLYIYSDSFVIDTAHNALQYVSAMNPLFVETPAYRWRMDPEGEFISSQEQPYQHKDRNPYLEFAPLEPAESSASGAAAAG